MTASPRRKPHCRTCGKPMAGHTRQGGAVVCPSMSSLPSPPPSPSATQKTFRINSPMRLRSPVEEIDIPIIPGFHRPNPHWVEPASHRPPLAPLPIENFQHHNGSDHSTEPITDDSDTFSDKVNRDENSSNSTNSEEDALLNAALATSTPLASIFSTPKENIADVRRAARERGVHTGLMRRPGARMDEKTKFLFGHGDSVPSWWLVIGRDAEAVKNLVNLQQKDTPGRSHPGKKSSQATLTQSFATGFSHLLMAGVLGGLVVLLGASQVM